MTPEAESSIDSPSSWSRAIRIAKEQTPDAANAGMIATEQFAIPNTSPEVRKVYGPNELPNDADVELASQTCRDGTNHARLQEFAELLVQRNRMDRWEHATQVMKKSVSGGSQSDLDETEEEHPAAEIIREHWKSVVENGPDDEREQFQEWLRRRKGGSNRAVGDEEPDGRYRRKVQDDAARHDDQVDKGRRLNRKKEKRIRRRG